MDTNLIIGAFGVIATLIAGAWVLLTLAGRQWARGQEIQNKAQEAQFVALNTNLALLQARMERDYNNMARLELKLSESERSALLAFALKTEVERVQRNLEERIMSTLGEIKAMGVRIDEWLKTISGYMERTSDKLQHRDGGHG